MSGVAVAVGSGVGVGLGVAVAVGGTGEGDGVGVGGGVPPHPAAIHTKSTRLRAFNSCRRIEIPPANFLFAKSLGYDTLIMSAAFGGGDQVG
jgi:hypothetical protein